MNDSVSVAVLQGYLRLRDGSHGTRSVALDYSHTAHNQSAVEFAPPPSRQALPAPPSRQALPAPLRPVEYDRHGDWNCSKVSLVFHVSIYH